MIRRPVNLALQGGGAHGAYTWGVLDRLLECGTVWIDAISGTSAGAMNAVVLASGLIDGGEDGARAALARFWQAVADAAIASPLKRSPIDILMGNWSLDTSPMYLWFDLMNRIASPYEINPLNLNPLREIVEAHVEFERLRATPGPRLFVTATNVETGLPKVFRRPEMQSDMVMASACLPLLFQAVEIDGVPYWDGGYTGNPALWPLYQTPTTPDIVLVQINPLRRPGAPKSARDIWNRLNEITFNDALLKELRAIDFVGRLVHEKRIGPPRYRKMLVHVIRADEALAPLGASSKLNAEWAFLCHLRDIGRDAASEWLERHRDALGERSTIDRRAMFESAQVKHKT